MVSMWFGLFCWVFFVSFFHLFVVGLGFFGGGFGFFGGNFLFVWVFLLFFYKTRKPQDAKHGSLHTEKGKKSKAGEHCSLGQLSHL